MTNDEINLRPYLAFMGRSWLRILISVVVLTGITLGVFFVLPPQYRAYTILVTPIIPSSESPTVAPGEASPLSILQGISESQPVMREVALKTKIRTADLKTIIRVRRDNEYGQVVIYATTGKKELSVQIVQTAIEKIRELTGTLALTIAEQQTELLEDALRKEEAKLEDVEREVSQAQSRFSTIPEPNGSPVNFNYVKRLQQLDLEIAAQERKISTARDFASKVAAVSPETPIADTAREAFRAKVVGLEYDLQVAFTKYGDSAPEVESLRRQIRAARKQFADEMARRKAAADASLDPAIAESEAELAALKYTRDAIIELSKKAPSESLQFARLQRKLTNQQQTVRIVREQYDQAKLRSEYYKMPWSILQEPILESAPVNKKYGTIAMIAASIALILTLIVHGFWAGRLIRKGEL